VMLGVTICCGVALYREGFVRKWPTRRRTDTRRVRLHSI